MDKKIATQIAEDKLNEIVSGEKSKLMNLLIESEHEFINKNEVEYQIRCFAFYDDKKQRTTKNSGLLYCLCHEANSFMNKICLVLSSALDSKSISRHFRSFPLIFAYFIAQPRHPPTA